MFEGAKIEAMVIRDQERLKEFYQLRYDVFVTEQQAAPQAWYPDKQLKDDFDARGTHIGCYFNGALVGTLSLIIKDSDLLMIERIHELESDTHYQYAEAMRFIIVDDDHVNKFGIRGKIATELFKELGKVVIANEITHIYAQSTEKTQRLYELIGFEKIGPYKVYEGISNECPMLLEVSKMNQKILQGVKA